MYTNAHCRCDACATAQREYGKRRRRQIRDGEKQIEHGTPNGYKLGCRCIVCKEAHAAWVAEYRAKTRESKDFEHGTFKGYTVAGCRCDECRAKFATSTKKSWLKSQYGITPEEFADMLAKQDGKCASCGDAFEDRRSIHIDHNHKTGKVRDLLCRDCNLGLGYFRDDPARIRAILEYTERHTTTTA